MGKLYLQGVCFLISSLASVCGAAERQYFLQDWSSLMWDEARTHCQACFKDLVTVTPENIKSITQNLTSDCWVGLRKNFSSAGEANMSWSRWADEEPLNSSRSWSHWADREPLIFQNWYPGWPVLASTPEPGGEAEYVSSIEDSCVAMLSFGAWVEKNCSDLLPFICYEDRFFGRAGVTNITSEGAVLTWLPAPGVVGHYRVEVKVDEELKQFQSNSLTYDLVNLTAGTHYSVQVFPVKCTRALDPQEIAFYTSPNKVENLSVTTVTETSVFLSWKQPAGRVASYLIEVQGEKQIQNKTEGREVCRLTPGNTYTFTVRAGAGDNATWSEESRITEYTKPGRVSDLKVSEHTANSLRLRWVPPHGNASGFRVTAASDSRVLFDETVTQPQVTVTPLPPGSRITLGVTALTANNTLEGRPVTAVTYTAPGRISNLTLTTTFDSLTATWTPPEGDALRFIAELRLEGEGGAVTDNLTEPRKHFDGLKTAANYTVTVSALTGPFRGPSVGASKFTELLPPTNATVQSSDKHQITFQWSAPDNIANATYSVRVNSSFWGHNRSEDLEEITFHRFDDLESGTKYDFEVRTVADGKSSNASVASHYTDAEKREIGLSMSCSSPEPLLCDEPATRESVFLQFHKHVTHLLGDKIFWKLEKQETEGKGTQ